MGHDEDPIWRRAAEHTLSAALHLKSTVETRLSDETGLLLADNEALINLAAADRPLRMTDIASRLILSPGGTTKVIDRLEAKGYVKRLPDPNDRRATVLEMTPEGVRIMAEARTVIDRELESSWAAHMTDDEAAVVIAVMIRVQRHIEKAE